MEETKTNQAIIVALRNVRKHPNADRLQLATVMGSQIVVGLDAYEGQLGVYFDSNLQLSKEYAQANDLVRRKETVIGEDGLPKQIAAGGMFAENRKVKTQTFRGEKSDGYWAPLESLKFIFNDLDGGQGVYDLKEGQEFDTLMGIPICNKFIAKFEKSGGGGAGGQKKAKKGSIMFLEHYDTPILARNLTKVNRKGKIILTEKLHGTSQRYGHVQIIKSKPNDYWGRLKFNLANYFAKSLDIKLQMYEWEYLNGTRRVVLDTVHSQTTGFHDHNLREIAIDKMRGQLKKGETLYFEVVGYEPNGKTIMPTVDTSLLKDKAFTKRFANCEDGRGMAYKYGQAYGTSEVYVYRITMTNEDGYVLEYPWADVVARCSELGIKTVPVLAEFKDYDYLYMQAYDLHVTKGGNPNVDARDEDDIIIKYLEELGSGASVLDDSHIKEGLGFRVEEGMVQSTFKHKTFQFKVLEGLIKDAGIVDMEEMSGMEEEVAHV